MGIIADTGKKEELNQNSHHKEIRLDIIQVHPQPFEFSP